MSEQKTEDPRYLLGEILAVLHCDGGQYAAKVGLKRATEEAIAAWHARGRQIDRLNTELGALKRFHDNHAHPYD